MNEKNIKTIAIILLVIALSIIGYTIFTKYEENKYIKELPFQTLEEKINNKENFIVLVTSDTCSHCEAFIPKAKEVSSKYKIEIYNLNTSKYTNEELTKAKDFFNASSTPTILFIEEGEEKSTLNRLVGNQDKEDLIDKLKLNGYIKE